MRKAVVCLVLLITMISVANAYLVDQIAVNSGDVIKIVQKCNNTTTTFKVYIQNIDYEGLLHLRITKNDEYLSSPTLSNGDYYSFGKVKIQYVVISDIPFVKVYGQSGVEYNVTKLKVEREQVASEPSVNVTVIPNPLIPNKKFIVMVDGLRSGKIIMVDPNGWVFTKSFRASDIIEGQLPDSVADQIVLRVLDPLGKTVLSKVLKVQSNYYEGVTATIIPRNPIRGGGLVVMLSKPINGMAMIIDAFSGYSNETDVSNGIAIFKIPNSFGGPIILRIMDEKGRLIYQTILKMASGQIGMSSTSPAIKLTLNKREVVSGQPVVATITKGGKPVDGVVFVEDSSGNVMKTVNAIGGKATITIYETGVYTLYAKVGNAKSNSITLTVTNPPLTIQAPSKVKVGQPVTIRITKGATYTITGPGLTSPMQGTSDGVVMFTPTKAGSYTIIATYNGQEKTATITATKTYKIIANVESGIFGSSISVDVFDPTTGEPANGEITVTYPNGMTKTFMLNGGMADVPVVGKGEYVIMFGGNTKTIFVKRSSSNGVVLLAIILIAVAVGLIAWKRDHIRAVVDKVVKKRKSADVLQ